MADIITAAKQAGPVKPAPEPTGTVTLGQGQLWWARFERQSDRYGSVFLLAGPDDEDYVSFESAPVGRRGRLVAVVLHTRRSGHCGDLDRGLAPSTPEVGEEITLGTGTLFTNDDSDTGASTAVGVKPDDGRTTAWLEPSALYRCHNQTVRLELRENSQPESRDTPRSA